MRTTIAAIAAALITLGLAACSSSKSQRVQEDDAWIRSDQGAEPSGNPSEPGDWPPAPTAEAQPPLSYVNPYEGGSRSKLQQGLSALQQGDLVQAAARFAEVRDGPPDTANVDRVAAAKFLGVVALKRQRYAEAAAHSRQAILLGEQASSAEVLRHVAEAHYNLGMSFFYQAEYSASHDELRRYNELAGAAGIRLSPQDYYHLGITAYLSEDFVSARTYFRRSDPALRAQAAEILDDPEIKDPAY